MPHWLIIFLVALAVVPGVLMILAGVYAMCVAPADYDRRRKRQHEHRCVHCGHDLRPTWGAATCPHCGEDVEPDPAQISP
jgi:hypothetical protein